MPALLVTEETTSKDLLAFDETELLIHSRGGSAFEYLAMMTIVARRQMSAHVSGLAVGGAVLLLAASKEQTISPNGHVAFRDCSLTTTGTADSLKRSGEMLEKLDDAIATIISQCYGGTATVETVREWMRMERWFSAEEAQAEGLVSVIVPAPNPTGSKP